jgi:hypothetical protein
MTAVERFINAVIEIEREAKVPFITLNEHLAARPRWRGKPAELADVQTRIIEASAALENIKGCECERCQVFRCRLLALVQDLRDEERAASRRRGFAAKVPRARATRKKG